jgi:glycolate oxidase iron-sulfur subunit
MADMQTNFLPEQLTQPAMAASEAAIRKCVHCGFCLATCPTYVLLSDERDSPRGRIMLLKDMLENSRAPTRDVVQHIDRCLSCLSCKTTCPSGVNYMHLVDHGRIHIETYYHRPWHERFLRAALAHVLPSPWRFRAALRLARLAKPFSGAIASIPRLVPLAAMLDLAPARLPQKRTISTTAVANAKGRVILLKGCIEPVLRPEIQRSTTRLIEQMGFEVVLAAGEGCCGALAHHLGRDTQSLAAARRNIDAWTREDNAGPVDAIVFTASGCGTVIKNYGFMLRDDPAYAIRAARISAIAKDISEWLSAFNPAPSASKDLKVAYHAACSLQHGQNVTHAPLTLLRRAGFDVRTPSESHLCCGSAGTYNILQPELAQRLRDRKLANIARLDADVIATGNIGCLIQLSDPELPVVHTVELLDWATGGPMPEPLASLTSRKQS